jgi:hypothetical protein
VLPPGLFAFLRELLSRIYYSHSRPLFARFFGGLAASIFATLFPGWIWAPESELYPARFTELLCRSKVRGNSEF